MLKIEIYTGKQRIFKYKRYELFCKMLQTHNFKGGHYERNEQTVPHVL